MSALKDYIARQTNEQTELEQMWEYNRLKSLQNWPMSKPSAKLMAEAGFYIPNKNAPEIVKCFSCFIELDGWEPTDDPWEEHRKRALLLNPKCKYIELGKKESEFVVADFLQIMKSIMIRIVQNENEKYLASTLSQHKKQRSSLKTELKKMGIS